MTRSTCLCTLLGCRNELWGPLSTFTTIEVCSETPCLKHPVAALGLNSYGVDYATRMNLYNLIFEMVILDVTVSASATRASFFLIDRVRNQCLIGFPANVGLEPGVNDAQSAHYHGVNDGAKRPLSWCLGLRPIGSGFALAARWLAAPCMNLYYNLYKKCTNCMDLYYTICIINVRII